jgi:hypothetical protein
MEGVHISMTHFVKTRHKSSLSVTLFVTLVLFIICWAIWAAIHIHVTHKSQGLLAQSNTGTRNAHTFTRLALDPVPLCLPHSHLTTLWRAPPGDRVSTRAGEFLSLPTLSTAPAM